jgi:hypothetical protein
MEMATRKSCRTHPINRFFWQDGDRSGYNHPNTFKSVKNVEVNGLVEGDQGSIHSVDFTQEDLSLLLPLVGRDTGCETSQA